jgi:hypothetical protein
MPQSPEPRTESEIKGDMCIALAMMATAMEHDGAVTLRMVLERPAVAASVRHARDYLRVVLGLSPEGEQS